jgi:hypothetical protein
MTARKVAITAAKVTSGIEMISPTNSEALAGVELHSGELGMTDVGGVVIIDVGLGDSTEEV